MTRKHLFLDHDGFLAFSHRGDQKNAPENTMPAFHSAVQLGFKYIETDVRATADGVLVIFHDRRLDRLTGVKGCLLYTSPSPRDGLLSRMPSSA